MKHLALLTALLFLAACNTLEGLGDDIGQAGDALSTTAKRTKENLP